MVASMADSLAVPMVDLRVERKAVHWAVWRAAKLAALKVGR